MGGRWPWREEPAGSGVWKREGWLFLQGHSQSQAGGGLTPCPLFCPTASMPPPPLPWFPGSRLQGGPAARPPAAAPSPYKPWSQSTLPPTLPACGDSLLAPDLPYPPSVRNRCRQTVRTTRVSSDSVWIPPPPLCLPGALPPACVPSLPSPLCVFFPVCLFASFLLMKTLTKWEWGGEEDQPARDPHLLVTFTHHSHSKPPICLLPLPSFSRPIKGSESRGTVGSMSPSVQLSSKSCQARLPRATRSLETVCGKGSES